VTDFIHWWLSVWIWVSTAIGAVFAIYIIRNWSRWIWRERLVAIFAVWIVPHVWEEWIFPGGFHYLYNFLSGSPTLDRYPMNELTDMLTNFGLLILGVVLAIGWRRNLSVAIAAMLFSGVEVLAHTGSAFLSLNKFAETGQTIWYNPGFVTMVVGYLPLLIGFIVCFVRDEPRPNWKQWLGGIGMLAILLLLVFGPEAVLKDPQSPYPFPDSGYYDQIATRR